MSNRATNLPERIPYPNRSANDTVDSQNLVERTLVFPSTYGRLEADHYQFGGIRIRSSRHRFNDYFTFEKANTDDVVSLSFNLTGSFVISQRGRVYDVESRQHNLIYSKGHESAFQNRRLEAETVAVEFTPEFFLQAIEDGSDLLKRFADKMTGGKPVVLARNSLPITIELQRALNELLTCPYTGGMKRLYLSAKSIELLVLHTEVFERLDGRHQVHCKNPSDRERIIYARDYLVRNFEHPPTLPELAREAGVNEYKLKRGFKEIFNTTVFGYLSEHRLELARQALRDSRKTIGEIAYELGYSSPQHFSNAFKKKFGIPPKSARQ